MLNKKVTVWFIEGTSIFALDYEKCIITVSGDYLILSLHNEESTEVTTQVHHLSTIKNWKTYLN
jgi:hypothetical protein